MTNLVTNTSPQHRALPAPDLRRTAEDDRWENEGGAVNTAPVQQPAATTSVPKIRIQTDSVVLISGLLFFFGLMTLLMTLGAKPEEAKVSAAMILYGAFAMALGVALAGLYWFWRSFRSCSP